MPSSFQEVRTPNGHQTYDIQDSYDDTVDQVHNNSTSIDKHVQLQPKNLLYFCWLFVLICPFQYGWMVSELNLNSYNNEDACKTNNEDQCLVFNGHSKAEWTLVINAWVLGGAIGSLLSGPPNDRLGRRGALIVNCMIMALGAALQAFSPAIWMLILGRFLSGIASGFGTSVTGVYISEVAPAHLRGSLGAGLQMAIVLGIFVVSCVLFGAASQTGWRVLTGVPLAFAGIQLAGLLTFMVESPRWLHSKGDVASTRATLAKLFGEENVELAMQQVESSVDEVQDEDVVEDKEAGRMEVTTDLESNDGSSIETTSKSAWSLLFSMYGGQLMVTVGLAMAQQLSGINAVFYYSNDIFKEAGLEDDRVGTVITAGVNALSTVAAMLVMNRFLKRTMLLSSTFFMLLAAVGMTIGFLVSVAELSIVFTAMYVAAFEFGLGPIVWMLASELFPTSVRANAMAFGGCINWLCNLIVGVGYPYVSDALTKDYSFLPFVVFLFLSLVFIWLIVPETTGKTLEEIQSEFASKKRTKQVEV